MDIKGIYKTNSYNLIKPSKHVLEDEQEKNDKRKQHSEDENSQENNEQEEDKGTILDLEV